MKFRIFSTLFAALLVFSSFHTQAQSNLLARRVSAQYDRIPLKAALQDISQRYQIRFSYSEDIIPGNRLVSVNQQHTPIRKVLDELFEESPIVYRLIGNQVVLNVDHQKNMRSKSPERQQPARMYMAKLEVEKQPVYITSNDDSVQPGIMLESLDPRQHRTNTVMLEAETLDVSSNFELAWEGAFLKDTAHEEYPVRPFQLSFITPLGTNGIKSGQIVNRISINLLAGYSGGVEGLELGGFLNAVKSDVNGVQLAGFGNVVGGRVSAFQAAGFFNVNKSSTHSAQAAGFVNVVGDSMIGFQAAGFTNIVREQTTGTQLAGFTNITGGDVQGFQASGFANISKGDITGSQAAGFINTARDVDGVQVAGFLNIARKLKGIQLSFINVVDTVEKGLPIGFISIVRKNGYRKFEVSGAESFYANAAYKIGVERFYNIFAVGFQPSGNYFRWGVGYGVGTQASLGANTVVNLEGMYYHINEDDVWTTKLNELTQLKLTMGYQLGGVTVFGGPTYNLLISRYFDEQSNQLGSQIAPWTFYNQNRTPRFNNNSPTTNLQMWLGFTGGVRF